MPKTIAYFRVFEIQFFAELRQYQSARYILGDNTEDELLKAYDKPLPFK